MIIDFHTHTFPKPIAIKVAEKLSKQAHIRYYSDPDTDSLYEHMQASGVTYSVNLPVITRADQTTSVNDKMIREYEEEYGKGIVNFGGLHPEFENYKSELRRLADNGIPGIKLHPAYQSVNLNDICFKRLIGCASENGLIVVIHAGIDIGFPDANYASVPMILEVIKDVQPEKFVLAHMGGWQSWEEVRKDLAGAPVWLDTSFSIGKIEPRESEEEILQFHSNMTTEAFADLVRRHGADRVLFGSDSPWSDQSEYIKRINESSLNQEEKEKIFSQNAEKLLKLN